MHAKHKATVKSWLFLVPLKSQARGNKLTLFFKHIFVNYCIVPHASQTLLLHAPHGTKCTVGIRPHPGKSSLFAPKVQLAGQQEKPEPNGCIQVKVLMLSEPY